MEKEERSLHFTLLDSEEKSRRLERLSVANDLITIWIRGSAKKEHLTVSSFESNSQSIILTIPRTGCSVTKGEVLYSFTSRGVSYFGQGLFILNGVHGSLSTKEKLFKCERRSDFRLIAFPHHQIFSTIVIRDEYKGSDKKVVSIKSSSVGDTQLFRDYLKFTGQQDSEGRIVVKLRVHDISASGLGLVVGEVEKEIFKKGTILENMDVIFDSTNLRINSSKVAYCVEAIDGTSKDKKFKIGVEFSTLDEKTEKILREKLIESLSVSEVERKFEDFLK